MIVLLTRSLPACMTCRWAALGDSHPSATCRAAEGIVADTMSTCGRENATSGAQGTRGMSPACMHACFRSNRYLGSLLKVCACESQHA